jgi:NAD+-dependent protein deacetylase sirtuin 5
MVPSLFPNSTNTV